MVEMTTVTGTCKFCRQIGTYEVPDVIAESQDKIDAEVTRRCNCEASRIDQARSNAQYRAEKYIDSCLDGDAAELAKQAVPLVIRNEIDGLTINVGLGVKLVMKSSANKLIVVKHSITKQTSMEE